MNTPQEYQKGPTPYSLRGLMDAAIRPQQVRPLLRKNKVYILLRNSCPPPESNEGEDWGGDRYRDFTLAVLADKDLIAHLQALNTGANQSQQVTQTNHEDPPESIEVQWEVVS